MDNYSDRAQCIRRITEKLAKGRCKVSAKQGRNPLNRVEPFFLNYRRTYSGSCFLKK